ncbi:hypothetical protein SAMN04489806_1071 [Paramicrobacterium humi]|uniref:HTH cro/C1-type domain-containing protein n=1 Tax=Paramicrobacterium humi TaxID=640635 RepID=A0A1H4KAD9_9MICO|nr:hypothetical protein [Microbacterium humi]SEB55008.1 hypothetical protein SAMN04489806_1071 [Microbacterium humi]
MAVHDFTSNDEQRSGGERSVNPPAESLLLNAAYKKSGLTAADLAAATGISVGAIRIALSGLRYRDGQPKATVPPDQTLARLASALGIVPSVLQSIGRERAAELLGEAKSTAIAPDLDATAAIAAREALTRQVLAVFSTDELRAEINRRTGSEG